MIQWIKIAGLSAILAAGVVTAFGGTGQAAITEGKLFQDRLPASSEIPEMRSEARGEPAVSGHGSVSGKGDRLSARTEADCSTQAWPYIAAECLTPAGEARSPRPVRTITIETREGANTSALVRVPQTTVAAQ